MFILIRARRPDSFGFILAELQMNLSINQNADATLKHFQEWQRTMNPGDDTHPNHHDCAILISKYASQATLSVGTSI